MSKLNGRSRWDGIQRGWTAEDVERLRGSIQIEYTLARRGAERLWELLHSEDYLPTLGAITGAQAVQMVKAGAKGIYVSGWQVAGDNNLAGETYPDQSLYPANSVPAMADQQGAPARGSGRAPRGRRHA
jgi:isocitrate lyase